MATIKQKLVVPKIVENHGNISKSMREVGYEDNTAKNPKNLTESKGYKEVLAAHGLTESLITRALVADIKAKPKKREKELRLGSEILGMNKRDPGEDKTPQQTVIIIQTPNGDTQIGIQAKP